MWIVCCLLSVGCMITAGLLALALCSRHKPNLLNLLFAGVFAASVFLFLPIHLSGVGDTLGESFRALLLSYFKKGKTDTHKKRFMQCWQKCD